MMRLWLEVRWRRLAWRDVRPLGSCWITRGGYICSTHRLAVRHQLAEYRLRRTYDEIFKNKGDDDDK